MNKKDAVIFAQKFMEQSQKFTVNYSSDSLIKIGPKSIRLYVAQESRIGALISDSFFPGFDDELAGNLEIWDSSNGIRLPDLFWAKDISEPTFEVFELQDTPFRIAVDRHQGFIYVFDKDNQRGSIWIKEIHELYLGSFITPFRLMISWMANTFNSEIVHASAIEIDGKGILLNGASGSGKSTVAIFAALSGHKILADDVVLIHANELYAIYSRCKLIKNDISPNVDHLKIHPAEDFDASKQIIKLSSFNGNFIMKTKFDALVFPIIANMDVYKEINSMVALRLFAPNSLAELFGGNSQNFFKLAGYVKSHRCYRQSLSGNLGADLKILQDIAAELS